jgi:hypothetical protein
MFSTDRNSYRRIFIDAWTKAQTGQALEPIESQIVAVARQHPEYHAFLVNPDVSLDQDFPPEQGAPNPFLHLALHLAILEQVSIDQPVGIRQRYQALVVATGDPHQAEHLIMECLAESIWSLQRGGSFDEKAYLECVAGRRG